MAKYSKLADGYPEEEPTPKPTPKPKLTPKPRKSSLAVDAAPTSWSTQGGYGGGGGINWGKVGR